jgi:hypothetical protein
MVQSNEFTAPTLSGAVKKATTAYLSRQGLEHKGICSDLALELADFKRAAADVLDDIEDLEQDVERLRNEARRAALEAVVSAAIAASGGLGTAARALRILRRLRKPDLSRTDWLSLVPLVGGGILSAVKALEAINKHREAERLARRAEVLQRNADRLGDSILRIAAQYRRSGCAASDRIS